LAASIQTELGQAIAADDALFGVRLQSVNALLRRDRLQPIAVKR
jgi:hypothetical protein